MTRPSADESFDRLPRDGWSVGDTGWAGGWLVTGRNGDNAVWARVSIPAEAGGRVVP
jgi:hypothetical protein